MNYLGQFIPSIILLIVLGFIFLVFETLKKVNKLKKQKSPFTENFLRGPGESLRANLDNVNQDIFENILFVILSPIMFYAIFLTQFYFEKVVSGLFVAFFGVLFVIGCEIFFLSKLIKGLKLRRKLRLGYEGEIAVGQELNQLMREGFYVFHDFPADGFNIDHIVVGPVGVFAVETKARSKPTSGNKVSDAKVTYDGRKLQFPKWVETKPLEQARNQALWLKRWLKSCVGEEVQVRPVITLPGWFIKRVSSKGFPVINPKQFHAIAKPINGKILNESLIKRIVHQLDRKCRDIQPMANEGLAGAPAIDSPFKV